MSSVWFSIESWSAWAPGLATPDAWRAWAADGTLDASVDQEPDISFVPAAARRRLSPLARMVFAVAKDVVAPDEQLPVVFASRHGELDRTVALLTSIAHDEDLSPTSFGLSVHNAIVGQWSMSRGDRSEATAVAAVSDALELAVIEAASLASERGGPALVVFAEGPVPAPYDLLISDVPFRHALALRVVPGDACSLTPLAGSPSMAAQDSGALAWIRAVSAGRAQWDRPGQRMSWQWTRR